MTLIVILLFILLPWPAIAGEARSSTVRRHFLTALGLTRTPTGCQVDHRIPLFCGGKDELNNLQLICGDYMTRKERIEQHCTELPAWIAANPCEQNICIRVKPTPPCKEKNRMHGS